MNWNTAEEIVMRHNYVVKDRNKTLMLNEWNIEKIQRFISWVDVPKEPRPFKIGFSNEIYINVIIRE